MHVVIYAGRDIDLDTDGNNHLIKNQKIVACILLCIIYLGSVHIIKNHYSITINN